MLRRRARLAARHHGDSTAYIGGGLAVQTAAAVNGLAISLPATRVATPTACP